MIVAIYVAMWYQCKYIKSSYYRKRATGMHVDSIQGVLVIVIHYLITLSQSQSVHMHWGVMELDSLLLLHSFF